MLKTIRSNIQDLNDNTDNNEKNNIYIFIFIFLLSLIYSIRSSILQFIFLSLLLYLYFKTEGIYFSIIIFNILSLKNFYKHKILLLFLLLNLIFSIINIFFSNKNFCNIFSEELVAFISYTSNIFLIYLYTRKCN